MLYLWKISQSVNDGYDTYDSAVVVAECEEEARMIHPGGENYDGGVNREGFVVPWWQRAERYGVWADVMEQVTAVKLAPIDSPEYPAGTIVVASFNAG